jgi:hypothetical protein
MNLSMNDTDRAKNAGFSLALREVVGQELRLIPAAEGTSGMWSLDAGEIPVAHLRFGHDGWALDLACKEERWRITRHRRFGWKLSLERLDGTRLGSYHGRRSRAGGSIELAAGTRARLRRSLLNNTWQIHDHHGVVCAIRSHPANQLSLFGARPKHRMTVTVDPEATASMGLHLVVLTACGVIMLTDAIAAAAAKTELGR